MLFRSDEEVARLSRLAAEGGRLRKRILQAPDVRRMPPEVLREVAAYVRGCGDEGIADLLERRIREISASPGGPGAAPRGGPDRAPFP